MMDVVFISYDEPNADENWEILLDSVPYAKRVHGVKGIANAHIEASKMVNTKNFFTVDGDNIVHDDFNWEEVPTIYNDDKRIHVWRCQNDVNGLIYGYGGVKLWPTEHIEHIKDYSVDFTTSVATHGFKVQPATASTTQFNTSAYNAWKSGFREGAKLSSSMIHNADQKSINRLKLWTTVGMDSDYGEYCILGARNGALFGHANKTNDKELWKINDFEWCKTQFDRISSHTTDDIMDEIYNLAPELDAIDINEAVFNSEQSKLVKTFLYGV